MKTKKSLSILLTLAMLVGLLPWSVLPARAEVTAETTITSGENVTETLLWSGSCTVTEDVTISGTANPLVRLAADTTVTVAEGATLTVNGTINGMDAEYVCQTLTVEGGAMLAMDADSELTLTQIEESPELSGEASKRALLSFPTSAYAQAVAAGLEAFLPAGLSIELWDETYYMFIGQSATIYLLGFKDSDDNYPASVTFRLPSAAINDVKLSGTTLTCTVNNVAQRALVVAMWYKGGKLLGLTMSETIAANTASQQVTFTGVGTGTGYTYKVMLIDTSTFAPLCEATAYPALN